MTSFLAHYGVAAVFLLMVIDAVFPAASELVMVYAGALASGALAHEVDVLGWHGQGFSAFVAVVLAGVLGYQLGAIAGWWIGYRGGRTLVERRGRWLHLSIERVDRAERWFERWASWAVLVGRVTPVARRSSRSRPGSSRLRLPGTTSSPSSATPRGASSSRESAGRWGRTGTPSTTTSAGSSTSSWRESSLRWRIGSGEPRPVPFLFVKIPTLTSRRSTRR